jgi:hypothetical protein
MSEQLNQKKGQKIKKLCLFLINSYRVFQILFLINLDFLLEMTFLFLINITIIIIVFLL